MRRYDQIPQFEMAKDRRAIRFFVGCFLLGTVLHGIDAVDTAGLDIKAASQSDTDLPDSDYPGCITLPDPGPPVESVSVQLDGLYTVPATAGCATPLGSPEGGGVVAYLEPGDSFTVFCQTDTSPEVLWRLIKRQTDGDPIASGYAVLSVNGASEVQTEVGPVLCPTPLPRPVLYR